MTKADGRSFEVVVVGRANTDRLIDGGPERGTAVNDRASREAPCGRGAQQAICIARLGGRAALVASIGLDEPGDELVRMLARESVDTRAILRHPTAPTGVSTIAVHASGDEQLVRAHGASERLTPSIIAAAAELLTTAKVVLVEGEIPIDALVATIRIARTGGVRVILDSAPAARLPDHVLREAHVVRLSGIAAGVLTDIEVTDCVAARRAADHLLRRGARAVCVGAPRGDLLVSDEGETWMPHLLVDAMDTGGIAGDAFAGALALALAEGTDLTSGVRFAHAAAALLRIAGGSAPPPRGRPDAGTMAVPAPRGPEDGA